MLVTFVLPLAAQQSPDFKLRQQPSSQPTQPPAADQRGTDTEPLAVKILPSQKTKEEADRDERERKEKADLDKRLVDQTQRLADETERLSNYTRGIQLFTFGLLLVAFAQGGLFVWQLLLLRDGAKDTAATAAAAKATADANKLSQRAYLSVEPQGIMPTADKKNVVSHVCIRNVGHLPAKAASWFMRVTSSLDSKMSDFAVAKSDARGNAVIFPETEIRRGSEQTQIPEAPHPSKAEGKQGFVYVWGAVFYDNGFGEECWTKFCHRYPRAREARPQDGGVSISQEHARYHEYGNDAT